MIVNQHHLLTTSPFLRSQSVGFSILPLNARNKLHKNVEEAQMHKHVEDAHNYIRMATYASKIVKLVLTKCS